MVEETACTGRWVDESQTSDVLSRDQNFSTECTPAEVTVEYRTTGLFHTFTVQAHAHAWHHMHGTRAGS